jgi:arylsulfatase A-like enzyme
MLLVGLAGLLLSCKTQIKKNPPNIILFLVDDLGWQDTSVPFYDSITDYNRTYRTPHMERLAMEGVKYTNAYASHVCSPSRISIMTGMNAARHRVTNWTLERDSLQPMEINHPELVFPQWNTNGWNPDSIPFSVYADPLPSLLKTRDYRTIHCGKAHFGALGTPGENPLNLGFDVNIAGHAAGAPGSYYGTTNFSNGRPSPNHWDVPGLQAYHGQDINLTEVLTLESVKAMDEALALKKPFFLYLAHYGVHTPIQADYRFYNQYLEMGLDSIEAKYASMVESIDKSLGDIMAYLDVNNLRDNTMILFMSDNGGLSAVARGGTKHQHNHPLKSGKGSMYEGGIRVPMLASIPGSNNIGKTNNDNIIVEDFFTTILSFAGVDINMASQQVDGIDFSLTHNGQQKQTVERPLIFHYPNDWGLSGPGIGAASAIIRGDWKLIYFHLTGEKELYNLSVDIGEKNNLIEKNIIKKKELESLLATTLRDRAAQWPILKSSMKKVPMPDDD